MNLIIPLTVFKVQSTHMTLSPCSVIVNSDSLMLTKKKKPSVYKHPSRKNNYRERRAVPYFPATPSFQIKFTVCQFQLAISGKTKFYFLLSLFRNQKLVSVTYEKFSWRSDFYTSLTQITFWSITDKIRASGYWEVTSIFFNTTFSANLCSSNTSCRGPVFVCNSFHFYVFFVLAIWPYLPFWWVWGLKTENWLIKLHVLTSLYPRV